MFCSECGSEIRSAAVVCLNCGAAVRGRSMSTGGDELSGGVIVAGYVLACLMPIVGFVIGIYAMNKNKNSNAGIWMIILSVLAFLFWFSLASAPV